MKKFLTILTIITLIYKNDGEKWSCGTWNLMTCSNQRCMDDAKKMVEKQVGIRVASDHDKIYFLCDNDYTLVGNVFVKCNTDTDTLSSKEVPKCVPIALLGNDTNPLLVNATKTTIPSKNSLEDGSEANNVALYLLVPLILILCFCVYKYRCSKRHSLFKPKHRIPPVVPPRPENTFYLQVLRNSEVDYIESTSRTNSMCSSHIYDVIGTV